MPNLDSQSIQLIIVAAVAVTMLLQAIALLVILIVVRKFARSMREDIEDLHSSIMGIVERIEPILEGTRELLIQVSPKVQSTVSNLAAMSSNLRRQTGDIQTAANEVVERFRRQSARVDAKLTSIFDVLDRATDLMSETISKPMRQLAGFLASAKAVVESLRNSAPEPQPPDDQPQDDKDAFA